MKHPSAAAVLAGCDQPCCHPSAIAYKSGCRCLPCAARERRQRKVRRVYGDRTRSAEPAAAFLRSLVEEGYPVENLARASGLDRNNIWFIMRGERERIRIATVVKIQGLTRASIIEASPPSSWVPSIGASRRLQALHRIGWHSKDIAGMDWRTLSSIRDRRCTRIQASNWLFVAAAYDRLWVTPGKSQTAQRLAARKGWASPLAWDDIDDPAATPDFGAETPALTKRMALYQQGLTDRQIARVFHVGAAEIRAWREDRGLPANGAHSVAV